MMQNSKGSKYFLTLFALPFAGVGIFMGYLFFGTIIQFIGMKSWEEIPAVVHNISVKSSRGSDSTTYRVVGSYSYTIDDKTYRSNRITLSKGSDNLGSYHHDLVDRIRKDMPYERVVCYVNPDDPNDAILDRDLRVGFLVFKGMFMLVFGGVGFGLIFASLYTKKREEEEKELALEHPEAPWLQNPDWQHGKLECGASGVWGIVIFAAFWNAISWPITFLAADDVFTGKWNNPKLLILLFPTVGLILIITCLVEFARKLKFGKVYFELHPFPGVLGGKVSGKVHIPKHIECDKGFETSLKLVHQYTSGSGKNRSTRENVVWEDARLIVKELVPYDKTKTEIPILFSPPINQRESQISSGDGYHWKVEVKADIPGLDLKSEFILPVFKTRDSRSDYVLDELSIKPFQGEHSPQSLINEQGIEYLQSGKDFSLSFPAFRHLGLIFGFGLFAFFWTAVCIALWLSNAPFFFSAIFSFFDFFVIWGLLDMAFASSRVTIHGSSLVVKRGWLWFGKTKTYADSSVDSIYTSSNMSSGNKKYYSIFAKVNGEKVTLGKYISSRTVVDQLCSMLEEELTD